VPEDHTTQKGDVRDGYDALATAYADRRTPADEESTLLAAVADRLDRSGRVLDAGSGRGVPAATALAPAHEVVCLDLSRAQLALAGETVPAAHRVQGDLANLPFEASVFDAVCALNSVIHVPVAEHAAFYREFGRVLTPGGHLLVSLGASAWSGRNENWLDAGVPMRWSFPDIDTSRSHLAAAGFVPVRRETVDDDLGGGEWQYVLARYEG
jgi:SAM-dependent methyltransferase